MSRCHTAPNGCRNLKKHTAHGKGSCRNNAKHRALLPAVAEPALFRSDIESHNRQTGNHNMFRKLKPEVASLLEPKTRTPDMKSAVAAAAAPPPHPHPLRSTKEAKPYKIKHLLRPGLRHGDGNPPAPRPVHKPGPETSDRTVTMAKTFVLNTTSCCFPSLLFPLSTST